MLKPKIVWDNSNDRKKRKKKKGYNSRTKTKHPPPIVFNGNPRFSPSLYSMFGFLSHPYKIVLIERCEPASGHLLKLRRLIQVKARLF